MHINKEINGSAIFFLFIVSLIDVSHTHIDIDKPLVVCRWTTKIK